MKTKIEYLSIEFIEKDEKMEIETSGNTEIADYVNSLSKEEQDEYFGLKTEKYGFEEGIVKLSKKRAGIFREIIELIKKLK